MVAGHSFGQERMPNDVNDFIRCLFLLLDAGCRVNARDMLHELPFQTSVFGELSSITAIPLLGDMWIMLAAAGSRLSISETQKLTIILEDLTTVNLDDLLSLHALGVLTAHIDKAKERLIDRFATFSVCEDTAETSSVYDDINDTLSRPLTLKDLCLNCIRMNCYPNAFVAATKLPLPATLQECVRPLYHTYKEMCGSTSGGIHM